MAAEVDGVEGAVIVAPYLDIDGAGVVADLGFGAFHGGVLVSFLGVV